MLNRPFPTAGLATGGEFMVKYAIQMSFSLLTTTAFFAYKASSRQQSLMVTTRP